MSLHTQSEQFNPNVEECLRLHKCWPWFLGLGIFLIAVGAAATSWATLTTLTTVIVFGWLLLAGGVVQIVNAFLARTWRGFFQHLLAGILHVVLGGLMLDRPVETEKVLTLMVAVAFLIGGLFRIAVALVERFTGWAWVLLNGFVTLALGVAIWRQWPEASYWVIGLFVGIDLIFNGWSWVMLGLIVKSSSPAAPAAGTGVRTDVPAHTS